MLNILWSKCLVRYAFGNYHKTGIKNYPLVVDKPSHKEQSMKVYQSRADEELAEKVTSLPLKEFSVKVHHLLVQKQKSAIFWSAVEESFIKRFIPTRDPLVIRSHAKLIYSLSKSKQATGNYQTNVSLILPFASPQSFTTMVTALSRIAPWSTQFAYIVQKLYYKRKHEFNGRECVSINYSLTNNGRLCDMELIKWMDSLNCVEMITMLRSYDRSNSLTNVLLQDIFRKLKSLQNEFNVLDLADFINIYLKHGYEHPQFHQVIQQSYGQLKRNINDICLQKIWQHIPERINRGSLKIGFVEDVIGTMLILRKGRNMSEIIWKRIKSTFNSIQNVEIKLKLEKIY